MYVPCQYVVARWFAPSVSRQRVTTSTLLVKAIRNACELFVQAANLDCVFTGQVKASASLHIVSADKAKRLTGERLISTIFCYGFATIVALRCTHAEGSDTKALQSCRKTLVTPASALHANSASSSRSSSPALLCAENTKLLRHKLCFRTCVARR